MAKLITVLTLAVLLAAAETRAQPKVILEVAASGGFVGLPQVDVQSQPACQGETGKSDCVIDENYKDFQRIKSTAWQPAVSTGLVLRFPKWGPTSDQVGFGVGVHVVLVPGDDGNHAAPAATAHFGTSKMQVFVGLLWTPTDKVTLPNGNQAQKLPKDTDPTEFIHRRVGGTHEALFAGIVISGVTVK